MLQIKTIFFTVSILFSQIAYSAIFKCVDASGKTSFQSQPCKNAAKSTELKTSSNNGSSERFTMPKLKPIKLLVDDVMPSSKPELLIKTVEYVSSGTPEEVLSFYKDSPYIKSCEFNQAGDNHWCKFAKFKNVSSGDLFIPSKAKNNAVEVYASYFYFR